ncbi:PAS domain-containing protein [Thermostaphylospora chromogena]|uniref:PAS domain-containing protein n=1 Tax=Thermostaphylospora chromogena TaxID=35622 RepID=UPI00104219F0|nr:PAS domain-containing protein [Thermostaphylospora chromogena]
MASVREGDRGSLQPPHIDPKLVADVYTNIDAGVYITDDQERIIAVNPRAEKMLALPAAYLLGKDAHDLLHRGIGGRLLPRSQCKLLQAFLSGKVAQGETSGSRAATAASFRCTG